MSRPLEPDRGREVEERVTGPTPRPWTELDWHNPNDIDLLIAAVNACHELGIEPDKLVARVRGLEAADKLSQIGLAAATQVYQERDQLQARVTALEEALGHSRVAMRYALAKVDDKTPLYETLLAAEIEARAALGKEAPCTTRW